MKETLEERLDRILNRLCKWRSVFAGWKFGTTDAKAGPVRCFRDQMDDRLTSRAELSALTQLLICKGVFTQEEYVDQVEIEANAMHAFLEHKFDGARATEEGIAMDVPRFHATTQKLGFPPCAK
jgi:hypothetical protein